MHELHGAVKKLITDIKENITEKIIGLLIKCLKALDVSLILNCEIKGDVDLNYKGKKFRIIENHFEGNAKINGEDLLKVLPDTIETKLKDQKIKEMRF